MNYSLVWLPSVLKAAGMKVALVDGWQSRGHGDSGVIAGVICHHTAGPPDGNMPSLGTLIRGRIGAGEGHPLPGPLAHLGLGRDGTFYVIAAGKCYHAGEGVWNGIRSGNTSFIGIEAENTGAGEPWPQVQREAYWRGAAAILMHQGLPAYSCAGHKEYALPRGRKDDPSFDMDEFRMEVAKVMDGRAPPPSLIPAAEPVMGAGGAGGRPTLRRGARGGLVLQLQRKLQVNASGMFDAVTETAVRALQRRRGLVADGIVGPKTWPELDQQGG
jgi:peptidoglycan hydrolase-like protein with peptidoglycan-binding domain